MRLIVVLLVLTTIVSVCHGGSLLSSWRNSRGWLQSLKEKLAERKEAAAQDGSRWTGFWQRLRSNDENDGKDMNALKCRIWITICDASKSEDDVKTESRWRCVKNKLLLLKRTIWNADDRTSRWGTKISWSRMWKQILLATREAAKSDLVDTCSKWRQECSSDEHTAGGEGEVNAESSDSDDDSNSSDGGDTDESHGGGNGRPDGGNHGNSGRDSNENHSPRTPV